ncbi:Aste57867_25021 [Aphanomyces stellatus]|uniref:Sulfhydryl oxidase n=1 Tax=Aphanomyces stellatus TaxID=120398 RepID=A0A485LS17_9STRA|nr:hypothetical protein As57867_024943 [Aphanomyces stellatus]VFU01652.1 Aste57867_25021 [Aphanomyces stellatus]
MAVVAVAEFGDNTSPLFAPDHADVVYLTDDNFDTEVLASKTTPFIVNFYSPECWHCKSFAPSYEAIALHYKKEGIRVGAMSCLDHLLCRKLEINGYPHLVFYNFDAPGENRRRRGDTSPQRVFSIVEDLQAAAAQPKAPAAIAAVAADDAVITVTPRPLYTASPEDTTHAARLHDAATAVVFTFKHELFATSATLSSSALHAFQSYLYLLATQFPGAHNRAALHVLHRHVAHVKSLDVVAWDAILTPWQAQPIPTPVDAPQAWMRQPHLFAGDGRTFDSCSGYTCGFWTLVHILVQATPATADETTCVAVYGAIRAFVEHFLSCAPCQAHFMTANPEHLQVKTPTALRLWAHALHNAANSRARHPPFPSVALCPRCDNDVGALLRFLDTRYGYDDEESDDTVPEAAPIVALGQGHRQRPVDDWFLVPPWCVVGLGLVLLVVLWRRKGRRAVPSSLTSEKMV